MVKVVQSLRWSLVLPVLVLFVSVTVQGVNIFHDVPKPRGPHLGKIVPASLPGWSSRDLPLGENEFVTKQAERILNLDEVLYREFRRDDAYFTVYVSYWGAGKMPSQLVASHTPDRCWTENGWHCLAMKFRQVMRVDGVPLQPAEWRLFEPPNGGKPTYVVFWHLVEGRVYDYGERFNENPEPFRWLRDAVQQAFLGNREQYFIRITSSAPSEKLWLDPGFIECLRGLRQLGLTEIRRANDKNQ